MKYVVLMLLLSCVPAFAASSTVNLSAITAASSIELTNKVLTLVSNTTSRLSSFTQIMNLLANQPTNSVTLSNLVAKGYLSISGQTNRLSIATNLLLLDGVAFTSGTNGAAGSNGTNGATGATGPAPSGTGYVHVTGGVVDEPATNLIRLNGFTIGTLPAGTVGDTAYVTDLTSPAYLTTNAGGGFVVGPVFYDGTNWVSH